MEVQVRRDSNSDSETEPELEVEAQLEPEPKPKREPDSDELEDRARKLLEDPALLYKIGQSVKWVVGETDNILHFILILLAKQSIEIRGPSSGGKGAVADAVVLHFPKNWWFKITGTTDKAIRYLPQDVRILYIVERKGLKGSQREDEESTAEYDVKLMMSEGAIRIFTTVRDQKAPGGFRIDVREVKVASFIITTTAEGAPEELENRFNIGWVRGDAEQSERVVAWYLGEMEKPTWDRQDSPTAPLVFRKAISLMEAEAPEGVVVPYASALKDAFDYENPSVRRNVKKLIGQVQACARLHYKQRPILIGPEGLRNIVALPEDLYMVLAVGKRNLEQTFRLLSAPLAETLAAVQDLKHGNRPITVNEATEALKKRLGITRLSTKTVYRRLRILEEKGFISRLEEKGERNENLYDVSEITSSPLISRLDINAKGSVFEKKLKEWIDGIDRTGLKIEYPLLCQGSGLDPHNDGHDHRHDHENRAGGLNPAQAWALERRTFVHPLTGETIAIGSIGSGSGSGSEAEEVEVIEEALPSPSIHPSSSPPSLQPPSSPGFLSPIPPCSKIHPVLSAPSEPSSSPDLKKEPLALISRQNISGEEVRSLPSMLEEEPSDESPSEGSPGFLPEQRPVFFYRPVPPSEPCELCGSRPVEYEFEMPGEGILRRCAPCFRKLRRAAYKAEWVRLGSRTEGDNEGEGERKESKEVLSQSLGFRSRSPI